MKLFTLFAPFLLFILLASFLGCAIMPQTWPDNERNAENQMVVIQEKIGEGLQTSTLSLDEAQVFLTTLKGIRTDYANLRDRKVYRDEWDSLFVRLDGLEEDIDRAITRTPARVEELRNGDRIIALQRRIDDGRLSRRLPSREEREFQSRLDSIRREYLRMTEDGRYPSNEESADISQRLDLLERDLDRFR
ncbi:MAG: hypothetical protein KQH63_00685 [Desulfobulbaceae bacterium]|nr:hypothetical protein [Desulfobulbaceae bacterium]